MSVPNISLLCLLFFAYYHFFLLLLNVSEIMKFYTEFLGYLIYYVLRTAGIYDSNLELLCSRMA